MKKLLDLFLFSNVFTACCATSLCMSTERLLGSVPLLLCNRLHALVFGGTILVYNLHHTIKQAPRIPYGLSLITLHYKAGYIFLSIVGLVFVAVGLIGMPPEFIIISACCGAIAFAYSLPLLPFRQKKRIRDSGWLKILSLAGVWTVATSVLPMLYMGKSLLAYPFEIAMRFSFIFSICIIFDIRDMKADGANNINTLPQLVGLRNSYKVINMALLIFVGLSIMQCFRYAPWTRAAAAVVTAVATRAVAGYLKRHPSERGYFLVADGVMMVYALLAIIT